MPIKDPVQVTCSPPGKTQLKKGIITVKTEAFIQESETTNTFFFKKTKSSESESHTTHCRLFCLLHDILLPTFIWVPGTFCSRQNCTASVLSVQNTPSCGSVYTDSSYLPADRQTSLLSTHLPPFSPLSLSVVTSQIVFYLFKIIQWSYYYMCHFSMSFSFFNKLVFRV